MHDKRRLWSKSLYLSDGSLMKRIILPLGSDTCLTFPRTPKNRQIMHERILNKDKGMSLYKKGRRIQGRYLLRPLFSFTTPIYSSH
ncbi:hypothetical protein HanPSC8_Chr14g0615971 [Helianthus annuus]|nr:hypothetical protein HanPSC8_Chr14g0615971 [Helianthus annuus]